MEQPPRPKLFRQESVRRDVDRLEMLGVSLGHPHSTAIKGSPYALRELRTQHRGRPFRTFYFFDPRRQAVLLIGGDKTGNSRFYEEYIPRAERLLREYLAETEADDEEEDRGR